MGSFCWKGVATKRRYEFMQLAIPSALIDPVSQQPLQQASYNGETVIAANHDNSVALPTATGPPAGASTSPRPYGVNDVDIYSSYVRQSPWTTQ